jgi:hypothetical protein
LVKVVPQLSGQVFVSVELEKGVRWFEEIIQRLEGARAGILCLTAENLSSPWLHFEAGALAKGLHSGSDHSSEPLRNRIFTYLHGVTPANLAGPLAQYQSASTTREDTWSLIEALVRILFPDDTTDESWSTAFPDAWREFEKELRGTSVPIQQLLPKFERWFHRKTFDEPLQQCTDQNWLGRYDGARQTHDSLSEHLGLVRDACPRYQVDLYDQLLAAVESYEMDIRGLLFKTETFKLGDSGELDIEPKILRACENRRERIREIANRMLDPLAIPTTEEAAAFWLTNSFEQRKMLVHRREDAVRNHQRERNAHPEGAGAIAATAPTEESRRPKQYDDLPERLEARTLFEGSIWDLDRIFGYLIWEYLHPDAVGAVDALRQATAIELERFRAKHEGTSLMPLHYALVAMKAAAVADTKRANRDSYAAPAAESLFTEIERLIQASRPNDSAEPALDKGGQVRRTIAEIRSLCNNLQRSLSAAHRDPIADHAPAQPLSINLRLNIVGPTFLPFSVHAMELRCQSPAR